MHWILCIGDFFRPWTRYPRDDADVSPVRVLHVAQAAPEVGGIASFVEMISGPAVFGPGITTEVLDTTRPGLNRGAGRLSLVNLRRTLADAASVYRAARHADVVQIHTSPLPVGPLLRAVALLGSRPRGWGGGYLPHTCQSDRPRRGLLTVGALPAPLAIAAGGAPRDHGD